MADPTPPPVLIHMDYEVMFFDTDCGGVVHNLAYLRIIEAARTKLGGEMGLPVGEMAARNEFCVVLRTEIDYRQPAKLADHLIVEGWLEKVERLRFWVGFRILRAKDKTELVTCRQRMASITIPGNKPLRPPSDWQERFPHAFVPAGE